MRRLLLPLACALAWTLPVPAGATIHNDPVQFRIVEPVVREGLHVRVNLEAHPLLAGPLSVRGLELERGSAVRLAPPPAGLVAAKSTTAFSFEADLDDSTSRGIVSYEFAGETYRWGFDLSGFGADGYRPLPMDLSIGGSASGAAPPPVERGQLVVRALPAETSARAPGITVPGERDITVRGRVMYIRPKDGYPRSEDVGAMGITARIYDNDGLWNTYLTKTETDASGNFRTTFHWVPLNPFDQDPDIVVEFNVQNDNFDVRNPGNFLQTYRWTSGTIPDVGSDVNLGLRRAVESVTGALDILTNLMQARRWLQDKEGYSTGAVTIFWPEPFDDVGGSGSWYNSFEDAIHLAAARTMHAGTHVHEYGHFFVQHFSRNVDPSYCNGFCDTTVPIPMPWTCGHCGWCQETNDVAWTEGFPDYFANLVVDDLGLYDSWELGAERLEKCDENDQYGTAEATERFFQALLVDLTDGTSTSDVHPVGGAYHDRASGLRHEIFQVATIDKPTTSLGFISAFRSRYPNRAADLFAAQRINMFSPVDGTPPGQPGAITSSTHTVSVPSVRRDITITWTAGAMDDYSGVRYFVYGVDNQARNPYSAAYFHNWLNDGTYTATYTFTAPGTYYLNVVAEDWEKNVSVVRSFGPVIIKNPDPANLARYLPAGWGAETVARGAADVSAASVPLPTAMLPGYATSTWWNTAIRNTGDLASTDIATAALLVDGVQQQSIAWSTLNAGANATRVNGGPTYVMGGRHSFVTRADQQSRLAEPDEYDNWFGRQFVWSPLGLIANTFYVGVAPPAPSAWDGLSGIYWFNSMGLRMTPPAGSWWNLTWIAPDAATDYDCRIHFPTTSPDTGFASHRGYSGRPAGCLDGVLANRNTVGAGAWDVGVINPYGGSSFYNFRHVTSQPFAFDDSVLVTLPANDYAVVRELYVSAANLGPVSVVVDHDSTQGPVYVGWYDRAFTTGALLNGTVGVSDSTGRARVDVNVTTAGFYGVVIWRDRKDGTAAMNLAVEMGRTLPDLQPWTPSGWHSALVPRPRADGTGASTPLPDTLYGDSTSTRLNFGIANPSPTGGGGFTSRFDLDGVATWYVGCSSFTPWATGWVNDGSSFNVRAGRHTLTSRFDMPSAIEELHENDNAFAEQYVWGARTAPLNTLFARFAPPALTGGWEGIDVTADAWFNCDGFRTPRFVNSGSNGYWGGVVTLPGGDVDLRLHEVARGAKTGFGANYGLSGWGPGQSDFALMNFNKTAFRAFDVGVLSTTTPTNIYLAAVTNSTFLGVNPVTTYGPFTMGDMGLLTLYEVYLSAGPRVIELISDSGTIDWGLSLYGPSAGTYTKSDAFGAAWTAPGGVDESFAANVTTAGYYCLAVWRADGNGAAGTYRLRFRSGTTDAPGGESPARMLLAAPRPNPFTGSSALAYTLSADGEATLAIYDVRGARVRTLASGTQGAGDHSVTWDGRDEHGSTAPPGVYLVRLEAEGRVVTRRLVAVR